MVFDGVFYQADVWLDGAYLGDPEGYFFPHTFEITDLARLGAEHVLAVEVTCSPPADRRAKRNITGIFQHWDCMDPTWNPGGLWRPVRIERTGPVRITACACCAATPIRPGPTSWSAPSSTATRPAPCGSAPRWTATSSASCEHSLAKGTNKVEWTFGVDNPRLWWPRALGDQPLGHSR